MTKRDLLAAVLRVVGVVTLLSGLSSLPQSAGILLSGFSGESAARPVGMAVAYGLVPLLYTAVGIVLLVCAEQLSAVVFRRDSELPMLQTQGRESVLLAVALAATGIFIAARALPGLGAAAAMAADPASLAPRVSDFPGFSFWQSFPVVAAASLCSLAGGTCLALFATDLADWLLGVRRPLSKPREEDQGDE